jgi:hypothetical protein
VVVVPFGAERTRLYDRLWVLAIGWAVVVPLALRAGDISMTGSLFIAYFLPLILLVIVLLIPSTIVRRLPGGRALVLANPPRIELDPEGMSLWAPEGLVGRVSWEHIGALEVDRWNRGTVVATDGETIGMLDPAFTRPQRGLFRAPSLAMHVVRVRPDLFVLSRPPNRFSQPYGFRRPTPDYVPPDVAAIQRRQNLIFVLVVLVIVAAVLLTASFLNLPSPSTRAPSGQGPAAQALRSVAAASFR